MEANDSVALAVPWATLGPVVVTALGIVSAALVGVLLWVVRREIKRNDDAHTVVRNEMVMLDRRLSQIEGHLGMPRRD